jgi:lipoprotein-anchoring transpeptidase ErfK/SrfK
MFFRRRGPKWQGDQYLEVSRYQEEELDYRMKKLYWIGLGVILIALFLIANPLSTPSSYASSLDPYPTLTPVVGKTTAWAKVHVGPSVRDRIVTIYRPGTAVTIYATVNGQTIWEGNSTWYRVSPLSSTPFYIYAGLVKVAPVTAAGDGSSSLQGKKIIITLSRQWMEVYENGREVYNAPITSAQPGMITPTGTYHIFLKLHPTTFYSPWPRGSPYYYPPSHINYALEWDVGGYFLHDSWWRSDFGPGTNVWHSDHIYGWETGTHGCITMPLYAVAWLYNWAPIGTTVQINP